MKRFYKALIAIMSMAAVAATLNACSSSSSSDSTGGTSQITVTGSISASSRFIPAGRSSDLKPMGENGQMNVTLGDLEIYVIYFSAGSVGVVQASVDATTGEWTFQIPLGAQINAIVRNKNSEELVGPITFVDSTQQDISGNDKESSTFSFGKGVTLGSIVLSDDGKFKVDATQAAIVDASNTTSTAPTSSVDFSGAWTLGAFDGTLPTGYGTACAPGDMGCHGPTAGEPIYMIKMVGKKFSYTGGNCAARKTDNVTACATTDGTVTTSDLHAAQIWGGGEAVESCGFKTGFAADDARAFGKVSIDPADLPMITGGGVVTPTQLDFGRVTFSVATGYGTNGGDANPNDKPWMKGGATSAWDIMECKSIERTGTDSKKYILNVCKGTLSNSATGYQANGPGGCMDASTGMPVVVKDWTALNGITPTCTSPANHSALSNMQVSSCSFSGVSSTVASASSFTCSHTWGTFTDANATTPVAGGVFMQTFTKVNAGSPCSGISDALSRYKCYANAYFSDSNHNGSGCNTEWRFNWNAANTDDFVVSSDSHDQPKQQYLTSIVDYSADGKSFTLEDSQTEGVSIPSGTSSIVCRVARKTILKGTQITASKILVDLTESSYLVDTTVAACVGEKNNSTANMGNGTELYQRINQGNAKFLFYLSK